MKRGGISQEIPVKTLKESMVRPWRSKVKTIKVKGICSNVVREYVAKKAQGIDERLASLEGRPLRPHLVGSSGFVKSDFIAISSKYLGG